MLGGERWDRSRWGSDGGAGLFGQGQVSTTGTWAIRNLPVSGPETVAKGAARSGVTTPQSRDPAWGYLTLVMTHMSSTRPAPGLNQPQSIQKCPFMPQFGPHELRTLNARWGKRVCVKS